PEKDYLALTRDVMGRRLSTSDPDSSLLLLKATGQVKHDGLTRFTRDSWQHQVFREWIAQGASWHKGSGTVKAIRIDPPVYAFAKPGLTGQLTVQAIFADGPPENITPFCDFRSNDDAVVEVNSLGQVRGRRAGDTAVVV